MRMLRAIVVQINCIRQLLLLSHQDVAVDEQILAAVILKTQVRYVIKLSTILLLKYLT